MVEMLFIMEANEDKIAATRAANAIPLTPESIWLPEPSE